MVIRHSWKRCRKTPDSQAWERCYRRSSGRYMQIKIVWNTRVLLQRESEIRFVSALCCRQLHRSSTCFLPISLHCWLPWPSILHVFVPLGLSLIQSSLAHCFGDAACELVSAHFKVSILLSSSLPVDLTPHQPSVTLKYSILSSVKCPMSYNRYPCSFSTGTYETGSFCSDSATRHWLVTWEP